MKRSESAALLWASLIGTNSGNGRLRRQTRADFVKQ